MKYLFTYALSNERWWGDLFSLRDFLFPIIQIICVTLLLLNSSNFLLYNSYKPIDDHSLGIIGMKERTLQFNGQLNIEKVSEGGTKLTLAIPKPGKN